MLYVNKALKEAIEGLQDVGLGSKKSCSANLDYGLCEHNLHRAKLILEGKKYQQVKEEIIRKYCTAKTYEDTGKKHPSDMEEKQKLITTPSNLYQPNKPQKRPVDDELHVSDDYYCNICGEEVYIKMTESSIRFIQGKLVASGIEYDSLGDIIYKEVAKIVRGTVRFKTMIDIRPIIKSVSSVLRPEIGKIEGRLTKIRTNIGDDIRDLITLYIVIYTYAVISHMIFINHGEMTYSSRPQFTPKIKIIQNQPLDRSKEGGKSHFLLQESEKFSDDGYMSDMSDYSTSSSPKKKHPPLKNEMSGGKKETDKKNRLKNIINNAYYLIVTTRTSLLKSVNTIKLDEIKPLLITAYKWVIGLYVVDTSSEYAGPSGTRKDIAENISDGAIYSYLWTVRNLIHKTTKDNVHAMLGRSLETIQKNLDTKGIFENVPMINKIEYKDMITRTIVNRQNISKKDDIKDFIHLITEYWYKSYENTVKYFSTNIFKEFSVPASAMLVEYYDSWDSVKTMQTSLQYLNMISNAKPIYVPNYHKYGDRFEYDPSLMKINLAKIYRRNGRPHVWSIYVYVLKKGKSGSAKKELTLDKIIDLLKSGYNIHSNYKLVDRKDPVTGEYESKVKDYSSEIKKNMSIIEKKYNLFEYFDSRCPKYGLHTLDNNKKCTKCGIIAKPDWKNTSDGEKYYKKYFSIFDKVNEILNTVAKKDLKELEDLNEVVSKYNPYEKVKIQKWKLNEAKLLDWSRRSKISFNILINLGLSHGIKFEKIESGEVNPQGNPEMTPDDFRVRLLKLDSYYNNIIYQYYLLKNYKTTYDLTTELNDIIDKQKTTKGLQSAMIDIYDPLYYKRFIYYLYSGQSPEIISYFILNQISETMINIITKLTKNKFEIFGKDLMMLMTKQIVNNERLVSLPDAFKYKIDKREEYGEYASDSSDIESDTADAISSEEYGSPSEVESGTDVLNSESEVSGEVFNTFDYEGSDIIEKNTGED